MPADKNFREEDSYKITAIYRKRNSIVNALTGNKPYMNMVGDHIDDTGPLFAKLYAEKLGVDKALAEQSLLAMLKGVAGGYPTTPDYRKAAWVMAANRVRMLDGCPLEPFRGVVEKEWVPVTVVDSRRALNKRAKAIGSYFTLKCVGGSPATEEFTAFFNPSRAKRFLYFTMFDLHRSYKKFVDIKDLCEFVGMSAWILLDPEKCRGSSIWFEHVAMSDELRQQNLKIATGRKKECPAAPVVKPGDAPVDPKDAFNWHCKECYVGAEDCMLSMHRRTYSRRFCDTCNNDVAHFLPDEEGTVCLRCREHARLAKEHETLREIFEKESNNGQETGNTADSEAGGGQVVVA